MGNWRKADDAALSRWTKVGRQTQRRGHEDWMTVANLLIDIYLAKYFIVHGRKNSCRVTGKKKNALRSLRGDLEVPWTNECAMKGNVAPAKRLEKAW